MLLSSRLKAFCSENNLTNPKQIDKGHSSLIFLAETQTSENLTKNKISLEKNQSLKNKKSLEKNKSQKNKLSSEKIHSNKKILPKKVIIKIERDDSTRRNMLEKESSHLKLANTKKIGPNLFFYSKKDKALAMQYIEGISFADYIHKATKTQLEKTIKQLLKQAELLDKLNLDHGQLAGRGKNILVQKTKPFIIDFEKASTIRKAHNKSVLNSFFFKSKDSEITKTILKKVSPNFIQTNT